MKSIKQHRLLPLVMGCVAGVAGLILPCRAQFPYAYRANLDTVGRTAFYKIILPPELIAKCKPDLADLRVQDEAGKQIPYVLKSELPVLSTEDFREFPILSNEKLKDSVTEIVIANRSPASIHSLLLVIKN